MIRLNRLKMNKKGNLHEIAAYTICGRLEKHPLNEERGRIPFIDSILEELWQFLDFKSYLPHQNELYAPHIYFFPSFNTFFNCLDITELTVQIIQDNSRQKDDVDGYFYPKETTWAGKKLDKISIKMTIVSTLSELYYNFQRAFAHELIHAYEYYKRGLSGKNFREPSSKDFYERIAQIAGESPMTTRSYFAYAFYMNDAKELRAFSQSIQMEYSVLCKKFGSGFTQLPFDYIKGNIDEYRVLAGLKHKINYVFDNAEPDFLVECMCYVTHQKYTTVNQVKKKIYALLFNIEQTFDKALARAIEDFKLQESRGMRTLPSLEALEERSRKLKKIYEEYGSDWFKKKYCWKDEEEELLWRRNTEN